MKFKFIIHKFKYKYYKYSSVLQQIYCIGLLSFQCLEEAGGDWTEVSKCVDGDESKKLQLIAETQTKEISKPRLENVPTIVFNNVCIVYCEIESDIYMHTL